MKKNRQPKKGKLVFVTYFRHYKTGKIIRARDYGKKAFVFYAK